MEAKKRPEKEIKNQIEGQEMKNDGIVLVEVCTTSNRITVVESPKGDIEYNLGDVWMRVSLGNELHQFPIRNVDKVNIVKGPKK